MHDYAKQNPLASQRHGGKEYTLKADYVDLQEKLKQNNSIRKYKK